MKHFTPTLRINETSLNIRTFVNENMQVFWDILKPLLPFIIGLHLLDVIVGSVFMSGTDREFGLGSLIASYFYTALVISWHRVVIEGPDHAVPVNPFKPQKHELAFLGMGIAFGVVSILIVGAFAAVGYMLGQVGIFIGLLLSVVAVTYFMFRVSFYFPAKAVNASITVKEAFALSEGYFWKMTLSALKASLKTILVLLGFLVCFMVVVAGVGMVFLGGGSEPGLIMNVIIFILALPVYAYFQPLLTIIGVTALSNYYLHAVQSRPGS